MVSAEERWGAGLRIEFIAPDGGYRTERPRAASMEVRNDRPRRASGSRMRLKSCHRLGGWDCARCAFMVRTRSAESFEIGWGSREPSIFPRASRWRSAFTLTGSAEYC